MNTRKVLDPQKKWLDFKSGLHKKYNELHVLKALTEYTTENGRETCKALYSQLYLSNFSRYSFQVKRISSKLELLSPHSIPGTRLIQGICAHSNGKNIYKQR